MKNLILQKDGENSWIRWIKKRIQHNLNFVALFTGETGNGKSWTSIEMARQIDPEFNSVTQVAFSFAGLMRVINRFNDKEDEEFHKKKYKVVIFDECQTDVNRHDWQSKTNKFLNYVLSTFRHQNIIVFFTTPYEDYLDSAALKLFHAKFECRGWSKKTMKSTIRPKIYQYNAQRKKMYEHSLHVITPTGVRKMITWNVGCPPKSLTDPYELEKFKFTNALNLKITQELEAMEKKDMPEEAPELTERQEQIMDYVIQNGYNTQLELAEKFDMSVQHLNKNIKWMKGKGYNVKNYKISGK